MLDYTTRRIKNLPLLKKLNRKEAFTLDKATQEIKTIFDGFNSAVCSNCPRAEEADKYDKDPLQTKDRGCCSHCGNSKGYFGYNGEPKASRSRQVCILKKNYSFTKEYGFFNNENKTCTLPRELRSRTCSGWCCVTYLSNQAHKPIDKISRIKQKYHIIH